MKRIIAPLHVSLLLVFLSLSLSSREQGSYNYYTERDSLESYFNAHPDLMQAGDGEYAAFLRWKEFWKDRVYGGTPEELGSFGLYGKAVASYLENIDYYRRSTIISSDWRCLGPDNITDPWRGLVSAIYVDTAADPNMNTIFLGTNSSGIWKTTDGGENWHNVTDPTGIPLLGITDITGDPENGNIIYAATGMYISGLQFRGSLGIIKSTDGGVTWSNVLTYYPWEDKTVYKLLVDPYNPQRIYALVNNLLLRNNNAGTGSWDTIFTCPPAGDIRRNLRTIIMKPGDPATLYIAADCRNPDATSNNLAKAYKIMHATSVNPEDADSVSLDMQLPPSGDTILTQRYQIAVTPKDTSVIYMCCQRITFDTVAHFNLNIWKYDRIHSWKLAGTDMGVFYRDNDIPEWQPFNTGLPPCIVTDIEVDSTGQKIRIGTYGRGIYETDISSDFISDTWKIQSNTVISHDTTLSQRVEIDSSYTLTISAKVDLPPLGMITVRPGGRLVVDHGTLTNRCNNMWQGIRVLGRNDKPQNLIYQGSVIIKNGIIENARFGVSTNGGLITAENSVFRNNFNAVKFEYYSWQQNSVFKKVTFETTRKYLDTNYSVPQDLVTLWEVKGVKFLGCTFRNTMNRTDDLPRSLDGRGIYSINANYTVDQYDHVPANGSFGDTVHDPSLFKGLYYGIRACNSNPARSVKIDRTTFDHNYRGVYLGAADYSTITRNTFLIPNHLQAGNDTCYGLYLGTCRRYHVEANQFYSPGNTLLTPGDTLVLKNIGIIVDNSGGSVNEIYRNYFDTLDYAINAQRVNRFDFGTNSIDKGIPPHPIPAMPTGLVLKCNDYRENSYDELVTPGYNYGLEGIAKNQGANTAQGKDQAGNRFSLYRGTSPTWIPETDIKNRAANITYYHHNPYPGLRIKPEYYTSESIQLQLVPINFDTSSCCPSKLASPNKPLSLLRTLLFEENNILDSLANRLQSLVDDGNTEEMNDNIANSSPPDALVIRQDLLNASPYLSDSVMKSAIEKESVLPNEMIRDILVANPQAAKTDEVLYTLNNRFVSMPDSMLAEILEGRDQLSPKEALEAEIALHLQYFNDAYNELVRYYLTDSTLSYSADSIIAFLESEGDLDGQYLLASEYLSVGDSVGMDRILTSIPEIFVLDRIREQQHQDYLTYFKFLKSFYAQNKDIYHIDSAQIEQLTTFCAEASEPIASLGRNILIANDIVDYIEPIFIPDELKSTPERNMLRTSHFSKGCYLKIFPNPAKRYIIVEYNTAEVTSGKSAILLTIASSEGKILETRTLARLQDQQLIETFDYKPGLYLCRITSGKQVLVSGKFTIIQ